MHFFANTLLFDNFRRRTVFIPYLEHYASKPTFAGQNFLTTFAKYQASSDHNQQYNKKSYIGNPLIYYNKKCEIRVYVVHVVDHMNGPLTYPLQV